MPKVGRDPLLGSGDEGEEVGGSGVFSHRISTSAVARKCPIVAATCERAKHEVGMTCSCRCNAAASAVCLAVLVASVTLLIQVAHPKTPTGDERCLYGVAEVRSKVQAGDSCASLSAAHGVPMFDVVDRNRSKSCCEDPDIAAKDVIVYCKPPTRNPTRVADEELPGWTPRGMPHGKVVMTYVGGIGYINRVHYPTPEELPPSVNIAALAFAEDADGKGNFEMGVHPGCGPPHGGTPCEVYQGTGFDGDCALHINPSEDAAHARGHGEHARQIDAERRWLVSIVPRDGNQWPGPAQHGQNCSDRIPECWGENAAASLERIILRYRLDGIDVDFEDAKANPVTFSAAMCSLFSNLRRRLPGVIISAAFYGNPDASRQTIDLYFKVWEDCGHHITFINYQNYANWVEGPDANQKHVLAMGEAFGWDKFVWGVGVGGGSGGGAWRWWPANPGWTGATITQNLLKSGNIGLGGSKAEDMLGAFTWAGEFSELCDPPWCVEDLLAAALNGKVWGGDKCNCPNG